MIKKAYVLDTNILLKDPRACKGFDEHTIIIPMIVIRELGTKKEHSGKLGRNARESLRTIDEMKKSKKILVKKSTNIDDGIDTCGEDAIYDDYIINTAISVIRENIYDEVIIVSNDLELRIKADEVDSLIAEDYREFPERNLNQLRSGKHQIQVDNDSIGFIERLRNNGAMTVYNSKYIEASEELSNKINKISTNEFIVFKSLRDSIIARKTKHGIKALSDSDTDVVEGINPRNAEQRMALDLLLDDSIKLVSLTGQYGAAKTFLSLGAAMHKLENGRYNKLLLAKPPIPLSRSMQTGYKPGDLKSKYKKVLGSISSNLYALSQEGTERSGEKMLDDHLEQGYFDLISMEDILGCSFKDSIVLLDEGQLLTKDQMESVISRISEGSKIIITGDLKQQAEGNLIPEETGLYHLVDVFKDEDIVGHITLEKTQRGALVELLSEKW